MQDDAPTRQESMASMYGPYLSRYRGRGVLALASGGEANCRFESIQMANGSVLLLCDLERPYPSFRRVPAIVFKGTTDEGHGIVVGGDPFSGYLFSRHYWETHPSDRDSSFLVEFRAQQMAVVIDPDLPIRELRFGITNFVFVGTSAVREVHESGISGYLTLPVQLQSQDSEIEVTIKPVEDYNRVADILSALKGVDVTCEAVVKVDSDAEVDRVTDVIADLCDVLSIARGTKIQWVYRDHYTEAAQLSKRLLASHVTKQYGPLEVIDSLVQGRYETKAFVESAYSFYVDRRDAYRLHLGTIDTYLDAKAEGDYLAVRGVKMAVSMEVLKNVFLGQAASDTEEYITPQSEFAVIRKSLKKAIEPVLKESGVDGERRALVYSKLSELNRTPVFTILRRLCEEIGLQVSDEELRLVVACRDRLVHTGEFYCDAASPEERARVEPLPSGQHEYLFLVNFMDRLFLKLLGYSGPYIDWRSPDNPVRCETV